MFPPPLAAAPHAIHISVTEGGWERGERGDPRLHSRIPVIIFALICGRDLGHPSRHASTVKLSYLLKGLELGEAVAGREDGT